MKKLATLLLAAGMVVASTAPASAADVKLDGFYRYSFDANSTGFEGQNIDRAAQRMRLGLTIAASENLSGYTQFQLGTRNWGDNPKDKHGAANVQTRQMYIDWKVPAAPVKVRMGRAQFGLPADAFGGNTVMGASWGPRDGVTVTANATDWLDVTALWVRAAAAAHAVNGWDTDQADKADVFALAANLKFDGFSIAPWAAFSTMDASASYTNVWKQDLTLPNGGETIVPAKQKEAWKGLAANAGLSNTGDLSDSDKRYSSDSWYFGATATLTAFDPFKLVVAGAYGVREYTGANVAADVDDRKGWNVQAKASYKLGFGTPILAAWYASGDDADDEQFGGWIPSICGYTTPTTNFHDGATSLVGSQGNASISGTWAVQAGIEGMSFLSGLTHTAKVTYIQGTNNTQAAINNGADEAGYLTTSDSIVELSLDTDYAIYKNLIATLELAYLISDYDTSLEGRDALTEDDWRVALTFTYKF